MRRYSAEDERKIRLDGQVRIWAAAGLLDGRQASTIEARLRTDLKRTNTLLRAAIALFTAIIVGASVGLVFVSIGVHGRDGTAAVLAVASLVCFGLADFLAGSVRLYRYGVEEMLAASAVLLLAIAVLAAIDPAAPRIEGTVVLFVAAAASAIVYARFGFVYAAVAATICAAAAAGQLIGTAPGQRLCAAAVFIAAFFVARALSRRQRDEYPGDDYAVVAAAAVAGAYLSLNVHALDAVSSVLWTPSRPDRTVFYWATYAAIWIIPAAALADAIRAKDRALITVGVALGLVTLATNKPYLGIARQTWDPMLLGILLTGVAVVVRRWLASGAGGQRGGYTPSRVFQRDRHLLAALANVSVAWNDRVHQAPAGPAAAPSQFEGGRSGGGGGGATY